MIAQCIALGTFGVESAAHPTRNTTTDIAPGWQPGRSPHPRNNRTIVRAHISHWNH